MKRPDFSLNYERSMYLCAGVYGILAAYEVTAGIIWDNWPSYTYAFGFVAMAWVFGLQPRHKALWVKHGRTMAKLDMALEGAMEEAMRSLHESLGTEPLELEVGDPAAPAVTHDWIEIEDAEIVDD